MADAGKEWSFSALILPGCRVRSRFSTFSFLLSTAMMFSRYFFFLRVCTSFRFESRLLTHVFPRDFLGFVSSRLADLLFPRNPEATSTFFYRLGWLPPHSANSPFLLILFSLSIQKALFLPPRPQLFLSHWQPVNAAAQTRLEIPLTFLSDTGLLSIV